MNFREVRKPKKVLIVLVLFFSFFLFLLPSFSAVVSQLEVSYCELTNGGANVTACVTTTNIDGGDIYHFTKNTHLDMQLPTISSVDTVSNGSLFYDSNGSLSGSWNITVYWGRDGVSICTIEPAPEDGSETRNFLNCNNLNATHLGEGVWISMFNKDSAGPEDITIDYVTLYADYTLDLGNPKQYANITQKLTVNNDDVSNPEFNRRAEQTVVIENEIRKNQAMETKIVQDVNIGNVVLTIFGAFREIVQSTTITNVLDEFKSKTIIIAQNVDVGNVITQTFIGLRDMVQNVVFDLVLAGISAPSSTTETIAQPITINNIVDSTTVAFSKIVQSISIGNVQGVLALLSKIITQNIVLNNVLDRTTNLGLTISQQIDVGNVIAKISIVFKDAIQSITLSQTTDRFMGFGVNIAQNISFDQMVDSFSSLFRKVLGFFSFFGNLLGISPAVPTTTDGSVSPESFEIERITLLDIEIESEESWIYGQTHYIFVSPLDHKKNIVALSDLLFKFESGVMYNESNTTRMMDGRYKKAFTIMEKNETESEILNITVIADQNQKRVIEFHTIEIRKGTFGEIVKHQAYNASVTILDFLFKYSLYIMAFLLLLFLVYGTRLFLKSRSGIQTIPKNMWRGALAITLMIGITAYILTKTETSLYVIAIIFFGIISYVLYLLLKYLKNRKL